jgi:hypothetical protein
MGNEASTPEQPHRSPSHSRSSLQTSTPLSRRTAVGTPDRSPRHTTRIPPRASPQDGGFIDPVLAAAAVGAAAKRARSDGRHRRAERASPQLPFRIEVDNEWKTSLQRFAKTAASTARSVASVAEPAFAEVKESIRTVTPRTEPSQTSALIHNNLDQPDDRSIGGTFPAVVPTTQEPRGSINTSPGESRRDERIQGEATEVPNYQTPMRVGKASSRIEELGELGDSQDFGGDFEIPLKQLNASFNTPAGVQLRKNQVAPTVSTPAAFGGGYASAYPTNNRASRRSTPGSESPMSIDEMLSEGSNCLASSGDQSRHKRPYPPTTDPTSVASSQAFDDTAWRHISFQERQQQLLATPRQFFELVSKKLSEDRPSKSNSRHRRGRRPARVPPYNITPRQYTQSWMQNDVDENVFGRTMDGRSPSLSPPGSPISTAMYTEVAQQRAPAPPIVSLWDMIPIPAEKNDQVPQLISKKSDTHVLPAPMLKQSVLLDPPPSEFLERANLASALSEDEWSESYEQPLDRTGKRKSGDHDTFDSRSLFSGSMGSLGSLKRTKLDRRRAMRRRKMSSRSLMDKRSEHSRRSPSKSPKRYLAGVDASDDEDSDKKRRPFEPDESGFLAVAGMDSESVQLPEGEDEMLNEALMAFSTMTNLSLANEFPKIELPDELEYVASIRWQQLLAYWKHHEMISVMTSSPSSLHLADHRIYDADPSAHWSSSASTTSVDYLVRKHEQVFMDRALLVSATKNLSGLPLSYPFELKSLSRFTTHIGIRFIDESTSQTASDGGPSEALQKIKHELVGDITVEKLLHMAGEKHGKFSCLIDRLAVFASQDYNPSQLEDYDASKNVAFSVDIKDAKAIQQKAKNKYAGELAEVKDVLRAQVVFPTEGSLVCAFAFLNQYCSLSTTQNSGSKIVHEIGLKSEIVRIKNLFAVNPTGQPCQVDLPTGYRHLLLTVRLDNGILAGK